MVQFRVFLGAPLTSDLARDPSSYVWKTMESTPTPFSPSYVPPHDPTLVYPTATLDEASRRISLLYQNIIFEDADDEDGEWIDDSESDGAGGEILLTQDDIDGFDFDIATTTTTFLTSWAPTPAATLEEKRKCCGIGIGIWFSSLLPPHVAVSATAGYIRNARNGISLHTITSLLSLGSAAVEQHQNQNQAQQRRAYKVKVLVDILEVEGPDTVEVKTGPCAGQEVSILKLLFGDEEGCVCGLTWTYNYNHYNHYNHHHHHHHHHHRHRHRIQAITIFYQCHFIASPQCALLLGLKSATRHYQPLVLTHDCDRIFGWAIAMQPYGASGYWESGLKTSQELELGILVEGSGIDEGDSPFDGLDEADNEVGAQPTTPMDDTDDMMSENATAITKNAAAVGANPGFANGAGNVSGGAMLQLHVMSRGGGLGPIIAQIPPPASIENPVMPATYEPQAFGGQFFAGQHRLQQPLDNDKVPAWTNTFANTTAAFHQQMQHHPMISHPVHTPLSVADHAQIFENSKRQHQQLLAMHQHQQSQQ
ncbi:hypothetical protein F5J12DRAFT_785154 [Pisolithus orientalis]|uniref:uncharacterized protein n=1 Tax=Pisolithus orientalis TaxID=936130 RepID=UPI0022256D7F|nr:uncharacterized protein F5J12DRAFT_785154 [Pisolithus orientalis]KAI5997695.1 hypothetical protein F5J12DRAFT_785154 [Pisolithus orientalis]